MEYFIYIVLCIMFGLVVTNTIFLIQLTRNPVCNKREEEDDATYKGHYACTNCGESVNFSTQVSVKYCPFCGKKYGED